MAAATEMLTDLGIDPTISTATHTLLTRLSVTPPGTPSTP